MSAGLADTRVPELPTCLPGEMRDVLEHFEVAYDLSDCNDEINGGEKWWKGQFELQEKEPSK